jgi:hypothetical protein
MTDAIMCLGYENKHRIDSFVNQNFFEFSASAYSIRLGNESAAFCKSKYYTDLHSG